MFLAKFVPHRAMSATAALKNDGTAGALSDTLPLQTPCHGLRFLASGNVTVVDMYGNVSVINGVAGNDYAQAISQIRATGTVVAASNLVLLWGV